MERLTKCKILVTIVKHNRHKHSHLDRDRLR